MADYTGNYQDIAGRPSFFMSWTHFLWSNNFKYNDTKYPFTAQTVGFNVNNREMDKILDFNSNIPKILSPTSQGGNKLVYYIASASHPYFFKNSPNYGQVFDYIFVLNHNFKTAGAKLSFTDDYNVTEVVNGGSEYDGFSMYKINSLQGTTSQIVFNFDPVGSSYNDNIKIGSIILAKKFTMPITPHLNHSLTFLNTYNTLNKSFSGASFYNNPNVYGKSNVFRVHNNSDYRGVIKSGKRKYNLAFDLLLNNTNVSSKSSLFPVNEAGNAMPPSNDSNAFMDDTSSIYSDYSSGIPTEEEGQTWRSNSFLGRVWTLSNGYTNPFIFLSNDNYQAYPDQYSISKIKGDTFKADQIASGVYKMRLEIQEQA